MANRISVILEATTDKAVGALKNFKQSVADADGAMGKIKAGGASAFDSIKQNAGLASVAVVGAVGVMAHKSIEAASRLGESVNAVNVTFGRSAEGIKDLGEQAAESVGLSNAAFNSLAVQFSSFASTIAGEGGDVVGTIDDMTHRAADFASVMNIDVADAARLFQSGLAGETEPLKKFGIDLSAAAVEAHALATGMVTSKSEMTEAIKVQARYSLLMEKTEKTSGDFANTSDGLANSQRILAAKMEDTAAKVGKNLAPALATVTTMLSDMIPVAGAAASGVGAAFTKMAESAYDLGQGFAQVIDMIPFLDTSEPIAESLHEQELLARGTVDLVAEYAKGQPTMEQFIASLREQELSEHAVNLAIIEYRKQLDGVNTATGETIEVTDAASTAWFNLTEEVEAATTADKLVTSASEAVAEAAEAEAEALADLTKELIDAVDSTFNLESANLSLDSSYAAYQESVLATTAILNDSTLSDREKEQALRDLRTQEIGVAGDALATAEAYAAEKGAADGSAESARLQKEKLLELAGQFPELRDEIQQYIDKLNAVPDVISTTLTVTGANIRIGGDGVVVRSGAVPGGIGYGASGAIVTKPTLALIGEARPEAVVPLDQMPGASPLNGYLTPHTAVAAGWAGGSLSPAGATYSATVNNYREDFGIADMSRAITLAKLSR